MEILGRNLIGFEVSEQNDKRFFAVNPFSGQNIEPAFSAASVQDLEKAISKAQNAYLIYRKKTGEEKADFLETIALEIENLGDILIKRYHLESGLAEARAMNERGRTVGQLRLFAALLREGSWVNAIIDPAQPERQPLPRPDLRSMERSLGPVAIFGASNFPLAFSVAGGDTVSALAAGCSVVFKGHPSHPGTSELVGRAIIIAAERCGMPDGVFSLIFDEGIEIGQALVKHPTIKAVGFTGSFNGGKSIFDAATSRSEPIPVYAEMGSVNPVFVLPEILKEKGESIAAQYAASVTLGVGQFCTNPGLMFVPKNQEFVDLLKTQAAKTQGGNLLNKNIQNAYKNGIENQKKYSDILAIGNESTGETVAQPYFLTTDFRNFCSNDALSKEVFGPSSILVQASDMNELLEAAEKLEGHLTATVWGTPTELMLYSSLLEILEQKVGRIVINGFPTGVEVCHAMVHGGPYPATTDSRTTSVGTQAITRFTRPVCFQDMPDMLLPDELKEGNPLKISRKVNGKWVCCT